MTNNWEQRKRRVEAASVLLSPSILTADLSALGQELALLEHTGIDWVHLDIMDGHFVPNLSFGLPIVESLRQISDLFFDCHLMVCQPEHFISNFAAAGADLISIHLESTTHIHRQLNEIRKLGCLAGLALNPSSSLSLVEDLLYDDCLDLVLLMSVNPGYPGQTFIPQSLDRIERLRELRAKHSASFLIQVDGGIQSSNLAQVLRAGADVLVVGSAIFNQKNRKKAIQEIQTIMIK